MSVRASGFLRCARRELVQGQSYAGYDPAQIQKLIFLFQERGLATGSPKPFTFKPHNFGPFDPSVYSVLERLSEDGMVEIVGQPYSKQRCYRLSESGTKSANAALASFPEAEYLKQLSEWVRKQSFRSLVAAVYKAFPAMKVNSVFRD